MPTCSCAHGEGPWGILQAHCTYQRGELTIPACVPHSPLPLWLAALPITMATSWTTQMTDEWLTIAHHSPLLCRYPLAHTPAFTLIQNTNGDRMCEWSLKSQFSSLIKEKSSQYFPHRAWGSHSHAQRLMHKQWMASQPERAKLEQHRFPNRRLWRELSQSQ